MKISDIVHPGQETYTTEDSFLIKIKFIVEIGKENKREVWTIVKTFYAYWFLKIDIFLFFSLSKIFHNTIFGYDRLNNMHYHWGSSNYTEHP